MNRCQMMVNQIWINRLTFIIHHFPLSIPNSFPWRSLLAFFLALIGQFTFEPPPTTSPLGIAFYIAAFGLLGWAIYRGEWNLEII